MEQTVGWRYLQYFFSKVALVKQHYTASIR